MIRWAALALALGTLGCAPMSARTPVGAPLADRTAIVPMVIHVAGPAAEIDVQADRLSAWVEHAALALADHDIELRVAAVRRWPTKVRYPRRAVRRELAALSKADGRLHVLVVDRPGGIRRDGTRGAYWPKRKQPVGVITLSRTAPAYTLAHEIGHALGLRHRERRGNVMCSCDRRGAIGFDHAQGRALRASARRLFARRTQLARR